MNLTPARNLHAFEPDVDIPLDPGIKRYVAVLRSGGIETFESCEGGEGHALSMPTIRFHGNGGAGFRALAIAKDFGLPVARFGLVYMMNEEGMPTGPWWEMTFTTKDGS